MSDAPIVERVARAICEARGVDPDQVLWVGSGMVDQWALYIPEARASILAMREPTQEMIRAVDDESEDVYLSRGRAVSAWVAMIDEALKEQL